MLRSPCLAPEYQDLRDELSRARYEISIMKKEIHYLENMLETTESDVSTTVTVYLHESDGVIRDVC